MCLFVVNAFTTNIVVDVNWPILKPLHLQAGTHYKIYKNT